MAISKRSYDSVILFYYRGVLHNRGAAKSAADRTVHYS